MAERFRPSKGREPTGDRITIPHDFDAEQRVLAACLLRPQDVVYKLADSLPLKDFSNSNHAAVYATILELYHADEAINHVSVTERLNAKGHQGAAAAVAEIINTLDQFDTYGPLTDARRIRDLAKARRIQPEIYQADRLIQEAPGELQQIKQAIARAADAAEGEDDDGDARSLRDGLPDTLKLFDEAHADAGLIGWSTGFADLDHLYKFRRGDLFILGARPGEGKSTLAYKFGRVLAGANVNVVIVSLEMSEAQIHQKMIAAIGQVSLTALRSKQLKGAEWTKLSTATGIMENLPIQILDVGDIAQERLFAKIKKWRRRKENSVDVVIIDYLQLIPPITVKVPRQELIAALSRKLKKIAKSAGIAIIALSQLNRELDKRPDKRPRLSDLRESGAIEQDADAVIFLHQPDLDKTDPTAFVGKTELILAKNRDGDTGTAIVQFIRQYGEFITPKEQP